MPLNIPPRKVGMLAEIEGNFPMDEAVLKLLPAGTTVLSAEQYGDSAWTQTGRVTVEFANGEVKEYFLKLALGDHGRQLLRGEYTAITTIDRLVPGLVPKALAWGKYEYEHPETYFFIEDFLYMDMSLPSPSKVARRALELHSHLSPTGMFGFEVTTFDGILPHMTQWEPNWAAFFARLLRKAVDTDAEVNGVWPKLDSVAQKVIDVVVPKLLEPLQSGPDPIVPRLIHGDLWGGNMGTDEEGSLIFFDAGCFYAHNEMELGMWRRYGAQNLGQPYLDEYKRLFPPSEPQDEFDDRCWLYSVKFDLSVSAGNPGDHIRDIALSTLTYLYKKHAPSQERPVQISRDDSQFEQGPTGI